MQLISSAIIPLWSRHQPSWRSFHFQISSGRNFFVLLLGPLYYMHHHGRFAPFPFSKKPEWWNFILSTELPFRISPKLYQLLIQALGLDAAHAHQHHHCAMAAPGTGEWSRWEDTDQQHPQQTPLIPCDTSPSHRYLVTGIYSPN